MASIAIIGALEKEVAQIKEELSGAHESQEAGLTVVNGGLSGLTVVATTKLLPGDLPHEHRHGASRHRHPLQRITSGQNRRKIRGV